MFLWKLKIINLLPIGYLMSRFNHMRNDDLHSRYHQCFICANPIFGSLLN
jgi:hypothetical protein